VSDAARCFATPLPVYLGDTRVLLRRSEAIEEFFGILGNALKERGVTRIEPELLAEELPRGGRFRLWVRWHDRSGAEAPLPPGDSIYYCRNLPNGDHRVEMVHYPLHCVQSVAEIYRERRMTA
jgi:hypothetical protein